MTETTPPQNVPADAAEAVQDTTVDTHTETSTPVAVPAADSGKDDASDDEQVLTRIRSWADFRFWRETEWERIHWTFAVLGLYGSTLTLAVYLSGPWPVGAALGYATCRLVNGLGSRLA